MIIWHSFRTLKDSVAIERYVDMAFCFVSLTSKPAASADGSQVVAALEADGSQVVAALEADGSHCVVAACCSITVDR